MSNEDDNIIAVDFSRGRSKRADTPPAMPAAKLKREHTLYDATKLAVFHLFIADSMVFVRFKTQEPGVVVPEAVRKEKMNGLNFSKRFGISDFAFDDDGVRASLAFGGVNIFCDIPWSSVVSMTCAKTGEEIWWASSLPKEEVKS